VAYKPVHSRINPIPPRRNTTTMAALAAFLPVVQPAQFSHGLRIATRCDFTFSLFCVSVAMVSLHLFCYSMSWIFYIMLSRSTMPTFCLLTFHAFDTCVPFTLRTTLLRGAGAGEGNNSPFYIVVFGFFPTWRMASCRRSVCLGCWRAGVGVM
jgi:hypothetical protein